MRAPAREFRAWHPGIPVVAALLLLVILARYVAILGTPKGGQAAAVLANRG